MALTNPTTAFGELSVAEATPQIQVSFPYNINNDIVTETESNSATVTVADGNAVLQTGTNSAGSAVLETNRVLRYGTGQGGLVRFTTVFTKGVANSTQLLGLGDSEDGYFIGYNGTRFGVLRRADSVDDWTYEEDFDGTNYSGETGVSFKYKMNIDLAMGNIWQIKYQWLGYGAIRFYVEDPALGEFVLFHTIKYANRNTTPSIMNPTLPMRVEATNDGNTSNVSLKTASLFGGIEGSWPEIWTRNSATAEATTAAGNIPILTIRNRATFASVANRVEAILDFLSVSLDGGSSHLVTVIKNATTLTGASYSDISTATSIMEADTSATVVSGGTNLFAFALEANTFESLPIGDLDIRLRSGDTITVAIDRIGGGSTGTAIPSLSWKELF